MHTIFRAAPLSPSFCLPKNARIIGETLRELSERFHVGIREYSINSNHVHALTVAKTRHGYSSFLRAFSGIVAMKLTGAKKGSALMRDFWLTRPWSRIVSWGRDLTRVVVYIIRNRFESLGLIPYTARKRHHTRAGPEEKESS